MVNIFFFTTLAATKDLMNKPPALGELRVRFNKYLLRANNVSIFQECFPL